MKIKFLPNSKIDKLKWDQCVKRSFNGNIYAFSWYLDIVADEWDGLVEGNYDAVMPLPYQKRKLIRILATPPFTGQLGVFSKQRLGSERLNNFLKLIPARFGAINYNLNVFNKPEQTDFKITDNTVLSLDLIRPYSQLIQSYKESIQVSVSKLFAKGYQVINSITPFEFIRLIEQHENFINPERKGDLNRLRQIISVSIKFRLGKLLGLYNTENTLCGAVFIIQGLHRSNLIAAGFTESESNQDLLSFILDEFIKSYSETNNTLVVETENKSVIQMSNDFGFVINKYSGILESGIKRKLRSLF